MSEDMSKSGFARIMSNLRKQRLGSLSSDRHQNQVLHD